MAKHVSTKEAAELLGVSEGAVRKRVRAGKLDGKKGANGAWRIKRDALPKDRVVASPVTQESRDPDRAVPLLGPVQSRAEDRAIASPVAQESRDRELIELRERLAGKDELIGELRERLAAQDTQLVSHTDAVQGLIGEIQGLTVLVAQQTPALTVVSDRPGWFGRMFRRTATA